MISSKIEKLIIKYITKSASTHDLDYLSKWIEAPLNKQLFKDYVQTHYAINYSLNDPDSEFLKTSLVNEIRKDKSKFYKNRINNALKYAAIFIGIIGVLYFMSNKQNSIKNQLIVADEEIILELDNGNVKIIDAKAEKNITDASGKTIGFQKGNSIDYISNNTVENLIYNKISVPYGKTFQLSLSDGTSVHLNAGSSLKYPVQFLQGEERLVYVEGEAFFEVAKDKNHPFIVKANTVNIQVTGTAFNVSSYEEDENINTVLVEGSVNVYGKKDNNNGAYTTPLVPGELAAWNKTTSKVNVSQVDTSLYTSWTDGILIFKHMKFKDIAVKLERHYNLKIINNNELLNDRTLTARFEKSTIEHVLKSLKEIYAIEYSIVDNQIIIN